ncbi:hypothetical protein [Cryobacterium arcticum]|uniref:hypothetical protein n=1 Tax=Cryobacterium arcticum TaxID=670052 RepID=UPI0012ED0EF7|nr:hypothetical protein [Cryobacterium arcticum]
MSRVGHRGTDAATVHADQGKRKPMCEPNLGSECRPIRANEFDATALAAEVQPDAKGEAKNSAPGHSPIINNGLLPLFMVLTGDETSDGWGKQAGQYVRHIRRSTKAGPTFSELFDALLSDQEIWAGRIPASVRHQFRLSVAVHWRRNQWIRFTKRTRSLSEGPASFHSRRHQKGKPE